MCIDRNIQYIVSWVLNNYFYLYFTPPMSNQINQILQKYSYIEFTHENDKIIFENIINSLSSNLIKEEDVNNLVQLIEYFFVKHSGFDKRILLNPLEFLDSLFEKDLHWAKIDTDELEKFVVQLHNFEEYKNNKLSKKDFLEEKYSIKIILIDTELHSINANIYGSGLNKSQQIMAIDRIGKLFDFYPINYIRNIKLDSIVVANNFIKKDIYWTTMTLGWFETSSDNNIYLSFGNMMNSFDHELYHQAMQHYDDFDKWMEIRKWQNLKYLYENVSDEVEGFAREYWKENVSEDQATMAEEFILNYNSLIKRIEIDEKLSLKLDLIKKAFTILSDWVMNEEYFEKMNN